MELNQPGMEPQCALKCVACDPTPAIHFKAGETISEAQSDAAFCTMTEARSCTAGHICLGSENHTRFNATVHVLCTMIKDVMESAAEVEKTPFM